MREYELLYVVSGELAEDAATKVTDEINAVLLKAGGTLDDENAWGRRRLAYPIAKQDHGWYTVSRFSIEPSKLADFERALQLHKSIVRTVLVRATEIPTAEEAAKIEEAVSEAEKAKDQPPKKRAEAATPKPPVAAAAAPAKPKAKPAAKPKPETATEKKERQAKLEEKLGEILKES